MERPEIKLTEDARISIELANGRHVTLTIPKAANKLVFNYSDGAISISPKTTNEVHINLEQD